MVLLVPASLVVVATILRCILALWCSNVKRLEAQVESLANSYAANLPRGAGHMADLRVIAADSALTLYRLLQPLYFFYASAPIIGALGTLWRLARAWRGPASLQGKLLDSAVEHAFIPLGWGLAIALIASVGFSILRARLLKVETEVLVPAALRSLTGAAERKPGERKL